MQSLEFDHTLAIGQKVIAYWTNCGSYYSAQATISKVNAKSVKVTLDEAVATGYSEDGGGYPVGHTITCPRPMNFKLWSVNNCVMPVFIQR